MQQTSPFNELVLYHYWKNQPLPGMFKSVCGKNIQIKFPGWFNQGSGPDFRNARVLINSTEYFGDIELHTTENHWFVHRHQNDSAYNKVLLHVFVSSSLLKEKLTQSGTVFSVQIPKALIMPLMSKTKKELEKYIHGACGIAISENNIQKFKKIIVSAAETRLLNKGYLLKDDLAAALAKGDEEQLLYEKLFESMGVPNFKGIFNHIASVYPYRRFLQNSAATGFKPDDTVELWKTYFLNMYKKQNPDKNEDKLQSVFKGPYNNIYQRFLELMGHLTCTKQQSLLNAWMNIFNHIGKCFETQKANNIGGGKDSISGQFALTAFRKLFEQSQPLTGKPIKISNNRLVTILVNAILPYFLAWAELHHDKVLRQTLFNLFIILPGESENRKIKFMKQRLGIVSNQLNINNALREHQGLIQLHDDCCHYFSRGCINCTLANMLSTD